MSRALAALALSGLVHSGSDAEYASAVFDHYNDNGIDALYFDEEQRVVHFVQSKWSKDGSKSANSSDILKFLNGVEDLFQGDRRRFHDGFNAVWDRVDRCLDQAGWTFNLVVVHTGVEGLQKAQQAIIAERLALWNDSSEIIRHQEFNQSDVYDHAVGLSAPSIELTVELTEWGAVREPYTAFYGQVAIADVASWWVEYGGRLFHRNLRHLLKDSDINSEIQGTARTCSEEFWYLNNGITLLCDRVEQLGRNRGKRSLGIFQCSGASVINGAQTVGALGRSQNYLNDTGFVHVRLLAVEGSPDDFSARVTRATNLQNAVLARDFAALNTVHQELHDLLRVDGIAFAYKRGAAIDEEHGFYLEEAAIALACKDGDVALAVMAKSNVGRLWGPAIQARLFRRPLDPAVIWESVQIMRRVDTVIKALHEEEHLEPVHPEPVSSGDDAAPAPPQPPPPHVIRHVLVHGNRFVLHVVFELIQQHDELRRNGALQPLVRSVVSEIARELVGPLQRQLSPFVFKNQATCERLRQHMSEVAIAVVTESGLEHVQFSPLGQIRLL